MGKMTVNRHLEYWATHSSVRAAHSFAYSALLASLARSAALIHSPALSFPCSRAHEKINSCLLIECVDFIQPEPTVLPMQNTYVEGSLTFIERRTDVFS